MRRCKVRTSLLPALFALLAATAGRAVTPDPKLLSLVPPDAQIVAGMKAHQDHRTNFIIMSHQDSIDLADFCALTGVDTALRIKESISVAGADTAGPPTEHSLLVSGRFDQARIFKAALENGATLKEYDGIRVLVIQPFARERAEFNEVRWLAILDSEVLLFGSIANVQQELDRHLAGSAPDPLLLRRLARLRRNDDTWTLLSLPVWDPEIQNALSVVDLNLADRLKDGEWLQFGIRYGRQVEFEYEITTASSDTPRANSDRFTQSIAGLEKGMALLPPADIATDDHTVRGVIRISVSRYDAWLAEVSACDRGGRIASR